MEPILLVRPNLAMKESALEYRQEHFDCGETTINGSERLDQISDHQVWLNMVTTNSKRETVDPDWVLTDTFFAVRKSDHRLIGIADLRYELNGFLKDLGNCGYSVRPTERRQGYAAEILRLICQTAREHGMETLQLSVERTNTPSVKTIVQNGGRYSRSFCFDGEAADVYLIDLADRE